MSITNRVMKAAGVQAEGDKTFVECVFNGTSGTLTIGIPVYKDVTDAAEWNALLGATQLSPAVVATGGRALLSTAANVGANPICLGIYQPLSIGDKPNNGDVIRVQNAGAAVVSTQSPAAGSAGVVGGTLITSVTVVQAVPGAAAITKTLGILLATSTFITTGATIFAAASATVRLCNFYVFLG